MDRDTEQPHVTRSVQSILGWPTDTFAIDFSTSVTPHTILVFIPGNPGLIDWYVEFFTQIIKVLGPGYAARGASNAGHSTATARTIPTRRKVARVQHLQQKKYQHRQQEKAHEQHKHHKVDEAPSSNSSSHTTTSTNSSSSFDDGGDQQDATTNINPSSSTLSEQEQQSMSIPWTVEGQVLHKMKFVDMILPQHTTTNYQQHGHDPPQQQQLIFVGHSIGVHFTHRLLILRPDILKRTTTMVALMPFIRMDAPWPKQHLLDFLAAHETTTINIHERISHLLRRLPKSWVDMMMKIEISDGPSRDVAVQIMRNPYFVRNFFKLGLEEIRDVPHNFDVGALRLIGTQCPLHILMAGNDQWSPVHHKDELLDLQQRGIIPNSISIEYRSDLKHDFVTVPNQIPVVVDFCIRSIVDSNRINSVRYNSTLRSRL